jgi:hypothetical protein
MRPHPTDRPLPVDAALPQRARPWQRHPATQIAGALALAIPMGGIAWWVAATGDRVTLATMFLGPMVGGGVLIVWILALQRFVCGDALAGLGFGRGRPEVDLALGVAVGVATLAFRPVFAATLGRVLPSRPPAPQILELLDGVVHDPRLLALWLGPVVWIGVALFEELARAFLLRRLWVVVPGSTARWGAVVLVSAFVGLGHLYQGVGAAVEIGIQSIALGAVFLVTGRLRALVVAHGVYDSVQIVAAVIAIRGMGG